VGRCEYVFGCFRCCFLNVADVVLNVEKSHVDAKTSETHVADM
jgi:hypothetical protein